MAGFEFRRLLIAFALGVGIFVYQNAVVWTPLQHWYWNQYLGLEVFPIRGNQPGNYRVLAKVDRHNQGEASLWCPARSKGGCDIQARDL